MERKIWIVGSGVWADKIYSSITTNTNFPTLRVAARDFQFPYPNIGPQDLIWIASRPHLQLKILFEIVEVFAGNVVIEKPYAMNSDEYSLLTSLISERINVHLSTPWLHSILWQDFFKIMIDSKINSLKGKRVGNIRRSYCSPIEDRIPHDIYLLQSLVHAGMLTLNTFATLDLVPIQPLDGNLATLSSESLSLQLEIGFGERTEAYWEVTSGTEVIILDFAKHKITAKELERSFEHKRNESLSNMLRAILNGEDKTYNQSTVVETLFKLTVKGKAA